MNTSRDTLLVFPVRLGWAGLALAALAWVGGCGAESDSFSPPGNDPPPAPPSPLVVSDTVLGAAAGWAAVTGAAAAGSRGAAAAVYVSLAEGEIPTGTSATIGNLRTETTITTPMMAGGFDPVAIEAIAGDELVVEIEVSSGPSPLSFLRLLVPAAAPPIVVRTEPADGKRDVPLNARIVIVFSEPIDGTTVTGSTIRLKRGLIEVAGVVRMIDPEHLKAEFVPTEPLAPNTSYQLEVSQGIEDLDGEALKSPISTAFTTSGPSALRLVFTVQPSDVMQNSAISPAVKVTVQDALGNPATTFTDSITIALGQNPGEAFLFAMPFRVAALRGVATFGDLRISASGVGYTLVASAAGLTSATSAAFEVTVVTSSAAGVYERKTPHRLAGSHSRYVLHEDGRFELQYETVSDTVVYAGVYTRAGAVIAFDFANFDTGPEFDFDARGLFVGDSLLAMAYLGAMISAEFEEGWYGASPDTAPPAQVPPPGQLAFVRDGQSYMANTDGSGLVPLSVGPGDRDPAWSPDGQRIAFSRSRGDTSDIYVMDSGGSNVVRRTSGGHNEAPAWSPDGTRIAFAALGNGSLNVYVMPANDDGMGTVALVGLGGYTGDPAWSPDGSRLAFVSDWRAYDFVYDVYVVDADTSGVTVPVEPPLVPGSIFGDFKGQFRPAWSPDGQRLAYLKCGWSWNFCSAGLVELVNADGSGVIDVAVASGLHRLAWSPDGQTIAFTSADEIHWIRADGSAQGLLIANGHSPAWRP